LSLWAGRDRHGAFGTAVVRLFRRVYTLDAGGEGDAVETLPTSIDVTCLALAAGIREHAVPRAGNAFRGVAVVGTGVTAVKITR